MVVALDWDCKTYTGQLLGWFIIESIRLEHISIAKEIFENALREKGK